MPRTSHAVLGLGLIGIGICLGAIFGAATAADAGKVEDVKKDQPLDVRYAQLFLRQSQLDLERALDTNRRMPGSFQSTVVDALRRTVTVAQDWLDEATAKSSSKDFNPCLIAAETQAAIFRDDYNKIQEIQRLAPKSVNATDMERAKVALALSELRIERAKALDVKHAPGILQMQIDLLREQIVEMHTRIAKLEARN